MKNNTLTAAQIGAIALALLSGGYITYLNSKPELTPHEARTHEVILNLSEAAARTVFIPALPPLGKKAKEPQPLNPSSERGEK